MICKELTQGFSLGCENNYKKGFEQEMLIINWNDVDTFGTPATCPSGKRTGFALKTGKKGYKFSLNDGNTSIKGFYDKSVDDMGFVTYKHQSQLLLMGECSTWCTREQLDKGRYVAIIKYDNGKYLVYGIGQGLKTADYTWDITEGNGGSLIVLESKDNALEALVPECIDITDAAFDSDLSA